MSRKKRELLGPDGKPLDVAKYRPKPQPRVEVDGKPLAGVSDVKVSFDHSFDLSSYVYRMVMPSLGDFGISTRSVKAEAPLRARVEADVAALHDTLADFEGKPHEIEPVPPELADTYAAAFASAARKCEHVNATSTTYARREYQCDDCGRYFTRKPGPFGW